jgi:hypothetical protein
VRDQLSSHAAAMPPADGPATPLSLSPCTRSSARGVTDARSGRAPSAPERPPLTPAPSGRSRSPRAVGRRARRSSGGGVSWQLARRSQPGESDSAVDRPCRWGGRCRPGRSLSGNSALRAGTVGVSIRDAFPGVARRLGTCSALPQRGRR